MGWIDDAWLQNALDALRESFHEADSDTKRQMVQFLLDEGFWDSTKLEWGSAVTRFNSCLNPNKDDAFFKVSEVWALMKRFGRHHLFLAMAEDLGYDVMPRPTEARRQALLERIAIATEDCTRAVSAAQAEWGRLDCVTSPQPSGVARMVRRPKFSRSVF